MDFIQTLKWRGMLHDATPGIEEALSKGMTVGYIGFDPTAPSLTIGNYVQLMILRFWQLAGHKPIVLMGGATGRIGDPSGKNAERTLKSGDELDRNLAFQMAQMKRFLDFENGENRAEIVNNYDIYKNMNVLDFLRDVGKTASINTMLAKDAVKNRLETGLSFTEFSYQLLQGYDFQYLFQHKNCVVQMGGSDQWGNITSGTEFIRRNLNEKAYAVTTPLLTKSDGTKFGKSDKGNIWLDPNLTSPYLFYQFWLRCDDGNLPKYLRYFSFKSQEDIEALEAEHAADPRELKRILAEELTVRIHGQVEYENVLKVSDILFGKADRDTLLGLPAQQLATITEEIPSFELPKSLLTEGVLIGDLLATHTSVLPSKSEVRKAIQNNAISINKEKISQHDLTLTPELLLHDTYIMIENGKKNKLMFVFK